MRDATGSLAAAAGTDAGAVLTLWNPDESWSRDALLRVNAVLGPATRTHTIYEHIELVVHPLGVHLNEAVASAFWVRTRSPSPPSANCRFVADSFFGRHWRCMLPSDVLVQNEAMSKN